eukprot:Polyplicarium_translucidae@DN3166_c0_g1_i7.p1
MCCFCNSGAHSSRNYGPEGKSLSASTCASSLPPPSTSTLLPPSSMEPLLDSGGTDALDDDLMPPLPWRGCFSDPYIHSRRAKGGSVSPASATPPVRSRPRALSEARSLGSSGDRPAGFVSRAADQRVLPCSGERLVAILWGSCVHYLHDALSAQTRLFSVEEEAAAMENPTKLRKGYQLSPAGDMQIRCFELQASLYHSVVMIPDCQWSAFSCPESRSEYLRKLLEGALRGG